MLYHTVLGTVVVADSFDNMTIPAAPDDPEIAIGGDDDDASPRVHLYYLSLHR